MTGVEFSNILDLRIDKGYSAFLTNLEKNRIIKEATVKACKMIYKDLSTEKYKDTLASFINTNKVFSLSSNTIYTTTIGSPNIPNYNFVFSVKAKFIQLLQTLAITNASNASTITITFTGVNNLRTGELIKIAGVLGNTNANGTYYIQKINSLQFKLYTDEFLTIPVSGNATYTSGGTISRVFYNYCLPLYSDKKIDPYAIGTVRIPRYEVADNRIKITPTNYSCDEITIDYLSSPSGQQIIDVTDSTFDLEKYYQIDFLYMIADEAANLFAQSFKDNELFSTSNFEINKNK